MTVPASSPYYPINTREGPLCPSPPLREAFSSEQCALAQSGESPSARDRRERDRLLRWRVSLNTGELEHGGRGGRAAGFPERQN